MEEAPSSADRPGPPAGHVIGHERVPPTFNLFDREEDSDSEDRILLGDPDDEHVQAAQNQRSLHRILRAVVG